ncbi:MAG TPA: hypothetical protein VFH31_08935, partial [Pyrinomonadaceae bacterium]|nr:hypothetical protein [Pyrinomonadaceae bacterium]
SAKPIASFRRGRVLVCYDGFSTHVATTAEYLECLPKYSQHHIDFFHVGQGSEPSFDLNLYDAVFLTYGCRLCFPGHVSQRFLKALNRYRGVKIFGLQDEYDRTEITRRYIEELELDVVLTCVPSNSLDYVYPRARFPKTTFVTVLTGYVPERLPSVSAVLPLAKRPILIGYRGRDIGLRYGELAYWKVEIGRRMRLECESRKIPCDIEWTEDKRIYSEKWYKFVASCRTMLGSESGSNVFDFDGSIERLFLRLQRENPMLSYQEFRPHIEEREARINMGQISPRVFEAAALYTPQILLEGSYSDAIKPGVHYIELKKDFSNIESVLQQIRNVDYLEGIADRAYQDLVASETYSYKRFVAMVDDLIVERLREKSKGTMFARRIYRDFSHRKNNRMKGRATLRVPTDRPLTLSFKSASVVSNIVHKHPTLLRLLWKSLIPSGIRYKVGPFLSPLVNFLFRRYTVTMDQTGSEDVLRSRIRERH